MSARISAGGSVSQTGDRATPGLTVSEADVQQPKLLARIFQAILTDIAALKRRVLPQRVTFPPRSVDGTGTTQYRFVHKLGGIPDMLVIRWVGAAAPNLRVDPSSTPDTLVLVSLSAGIATVRLEASA